MFWWWVTFDGREQPNEQVLHTTHHIIMCLKCYYNSFTLLHIIFFSRWQDYETPNNHHSESNYQVYYFFLIHYIYYCLLSPQYSPHTNEEKRVRYIVVQNVFWISPKALWYTLLAQNSLMMFFIPCKLPVISIWSSCCAHSTTTTTIL